MNKEEKLYKKHERSTVFDCMSCSFYPRNKLKPVENIDDIDVTNIRGHLKNALMSLEGIETILYKKDEND